MPKRTAILPAIPSHWAGIIEQPKTIFGWPEWSDVAPLRPNRRTPSKRSEVLTVSTEITQAIVQLADINGIGLEGVRLRITAWAYRRNCDVTATLEVPGGRGFVTISRVDAWPFDPHINSRKVRKTTGLSGVPECVEGCHVHRYSDNAKCGGVAFYAGPDGNLPVAVPLPNSLQSLRDFLRNVGAEFNIAGLEGFNGPPTWEGLNI